MSFNDIRENKILAKITEFTVLIFTFIYCKHTVLLLLNFAYTVYCKIKPSRNGEISLPFTGLGKSCFSREFLLSQICLLRIFANLKFPKKCLNIQYIVYILHP